MGIYATLHDLESRGVAAVLCTVVRTRGSAPRHAGAKMIVESGGRIHGTIGGGEMESRAIRDALQVLATRRARLERYVLKHPQRGDAGVCGGEVEIFMEPIATRPTLLVVGGGHVGRALVHLGSWLGFHTVLSDDRPEFCTAEAVPGADAYVCAPMAALADHVSFDDDTWIVLPTRGMPLDVEGLPHLIQQPHAYLGVIGSRRRWATARAQLEARGVDAAALDRIHAPMGLEIGAETPEEIAVSVLSEILMLRRGGTGRPMRAPRPSSSTDSA